MTGTLLDPDRTPNRGGEVGYLLKLANGTSVSGAIVIRQDTFQNLHPKPMDRRAGLDLRSLQIWATHNGHFAPIRRVEGSEAVLVLQPMPRQVATIRVMASDHTYATPWPRPVMISLVPGSSFETTSMRVPVGHRQQFADLIPGPQLLHLADSAGVSREVRLQPIPGSRTLFRVPMPMRTGATAKLAPPLASSFELKPTAALPIVSGDASFLVDVPHVLRRFELLRVYLNLVRTIDKSNPIRVDMVLIDAIGNRTERQVQYYNQVSGYHACDPAPNDLGNQCRDTYFERSVSVPRMVFEGNYLAEVGNYQIWVTSGGKTVRMGFRVTASADAR